MSKQLASVFAGACLVAGVFYYLDFLRKGMTLDRQTGIGSIKALSWKQFEELLGEFYRRQGYSVTENVGNEPDGGVDLRMRKDGRLYLVQCKHWKVFSVGASVVREMYGVMTADHAAKGIIVTSGAFSREAKDFAEGKPIDLIEGGKLEEMIRAAQRNHA